MKKKFMIFVMCIMLAFSAMACGYTQVEQGYEGIKVNTLGDGKGSIETKGVGRHFYPIKYDMFTFPLFKQNYVWTQDKSEGSKNDESITFQSKESLTFNTDIGISYSVMKGRSADIYTMYHKDIETITDVDMRNSVRDAFNRIGSGLSVEQIYGEGKAEFIEQVQRDVVDFWQPIGIEVHKLYLVGEMRPPDSVKESIAQKIAATQKAQTVENEIAEREAARLKAQKDTDAAAYDIERKAQADARAIELVQEQLSKSPQYIEYLKATRWDGELPQIVGSGTMPMISLNND